MRPRGKIPMMEPLEEKRDATFVARHPMPDLRTYRQLDVLPSTNGSSTQTQTQTPKKREPDQVAQPVRTQSPTRRQSRPRKRQQQAQGQQQQTEQQQQPQQPIRQEIKLERIEPISLTQIPTLKPEEVKIKLPERTPEESAKLMKRALHAEAYNRIDDKAAKRREKAQRKFEKRMEKAKTEEEKAKAQEKLAKDMARAEMKREKAEAKLDFKYDMAMLNKIGRKEQGELNKLLTPDGRLPEGLTPEQRMEIGKAHYNVVMTNSAKEMLRKQYRENKRRIEGTYNTAKLKDARTALEGASASREEATNTAGNMAARYRNALKDAEQKFGPLLGDDKFGIAAKQAEEAREKAAIDEAVKTGKPVEFTYNNGQKVTFRLAENQNAQANTNISQSEQLPDMNKAATGGPMTFENADGSKTTVMDWGDTTTIHPDGTRVSTFHKDGIEYTVTDKNNKIIDAKGEVRETVVLGKKPKLKGLNLVENAVKAQLNEVPNIRLDANGNLVSPEQQPTLQSQVEKAQQIYAQMYAEKEHYTNPNDATLANAATQGNQPATTARDATNQQYAQNMENAWKKYEIHTAQPNNLMQDLMNTQQTVDAAKQTVAGINSALFAKKGGRGE